MTAHDRVVPEPCTDSDMPVRSDVLVQNFGNVQQLLPVDGDEFRAWFAPAFARWLQANFPNPETVAQVFGVRNSTACNWWRGDHRASGDVVARAFLSVPQARDWFLAEWAQV